MARPRSFDETEIRSKLLQSFWVTGFDGTALPDLEEATGLSRKSLYNAFGDKREMFLDALRAFRRTAVETNTKALIEPDASIQNIGAVLHGLADLAQTVQGRAGCMVCNTSREAIRNDPAVKAEIDAYFRQLEDQFRAVIERGQAKGDIRDHPPGALAQLCVSAVVSISVLSKAGQPTDMLRAIATETVSALT
ncbi:MAG: TetR/AcrR family transcriptional regulator [Pseudomonadota bacterium]